LSFADFLVTDHDVTGKGLILHKVNNLEASPMSVELGLNQEI